MPGVRPVAHEKEAIFEILRGLRAFEVVQQANLKGSKASKVLHDLFSRQATVFSMFSKCLIA